MNDILRNEIQKVSTKEELNELIELVKLQQKHIRNVANVSIKSQLKVGSRVLIKSKSGNEFGTIEKINKTRAEVDIQGKTWNVPFSIMEVADLKEERNNA